MAGFLFSILYNKIVIFPFMKDFTLYHKITFLLGPLLCFLFLMYPETIVSNTLDPVLAVALWMIVWWIGESVSLSVTAFLPVVLFPLLDIMSIGEVTVNYANPIVFLF